MKQLLRKSIALLLVLMLMSTSVLAAEDVDYGQRFDDVLDLIMEQYLYRDDLSKEELYDAAMDGLFDELDPYSYYMSPEEGNSFLDSLEGSFVGIGVYIIEENGYVVIQDTIPGGAAEKGELQARDKIIEANGVSLVGKTTSEASALIMGEEGSSVDLKIERDGLVFDIQLVRQTIVVKTVNRKSVTEVYPDIPVASEALIGYAEVTSFSDNTDEEFTELLDAFRVEGKKYLLLDLRDNGGGYVTSGVNVLNQLVPEGPVLKFVDNEDNVYVYYSHLEAADFKVYALINGNSASATEFVSAAIQENGGTLIGETTFGKGVAQVLYSTKNDELVRVTTEEFFSGNDKKINHIGVTPDVVVDVPEFLVKDAETNGYGYKYHLGDIYDSVANIESIIKFLGYQVGEVDNRYDEVTFEGIKQFQKDHGLFDYGICDFATQDALNLALLESLRENDVQLKEGLKLILEDINKY